MKLADLDAGFVTSSPGTSTGLQFRCPVCRDQRIVVPIDPPIGPGPIDPSLNARELASARAELLARRAVPVQAVTPGYVTLLAALSLVGGLVLGLWLRGLW